MPTHTARFSGHDTADLVEFLQGNEAEQVFIEPIFLRDFDVQQAARVAVALCNNRDIRGLTICHLNRPAMVLLEAVKQSRTIRALQCVIDGDLVPPEFISAVACVLDGNRSLRFFGMDAMDTSLPSKDAVAIAAALEANSTLESFVLNAGYTRFDDKAAEAFGDALLTNNNLRSFSINMMGTSTGSRGLTAFASAINRNDTLHMISIHMGYTLLTDAGIVEFAAALRNNAGLKVLKLIVLDCRSVTDTSGRVMARAIKDNYMLQNVSLNAGGTDWGPDTAWAFVRAIHENKVIQQLVVSPGMHVPEVWHPMTDSLFRNKAWRRTACAVLCIAPTNEGVTGSFRDRAVRLRVLECYATPLSALWLVSLIPTRWQWGDALTV